jgi:diguanylate cyclase (GGDEF)-like protein/PAS domain S-box-containing protein
MQLVLLIPILGLLLIAGRWTSVLYQLAGDEATVLAQATSDTERLAESFEQHAVRTLRDADRTLLMLKHAFETNGSVDLPTMITWGLIRTDPQVAITVRDRRGALLASDLPTERVRSAVPASTQPFFDAHAARDSGTLHIDQPVHGAAATNGIPPLRLSRRLNDAAGAFAGVVDIAISPSSFTDVYREDDLGDHGILGLVGSEGEYRARRTGNRVTTSLPSLTNSPLVARMQHDAAGTFEGVSRVDGFDRLVAYRRLADYPLTVIAAKARDEVLAGFQQRRATYLMLTSSATVVLLLFFALITALVIRLQRNEQALSMQKEFLQTLVDDTPIGIAVHSVGTAARGRYVVWNQTNTTLFNVPRDDALGRTVAEVMPKETAAQIAEWDREMLASPRVQELVETTATPASGKRILQRIRAPIFGTGKRVDHVITITKDITSEQAAVDKLRLASKVFETTADGIVVSDADDRIIIVNAAFSRLTGFTSEDMLGKRMAESPFRALDSDAYAARMAQLQRDGRVTGEVQRLSKDGSELALWITAACVLDDAGRIVNHVRVFTDISRLKDAQRKLEQLANVDALTGLPNRRLFADRMEQARRRAQRLGKRFGLLFIDLNGFKKVNDDHGHVAGDALLNEVARRLQRCVRGHDSVCRLGGDEFTVIMEDAALPEDAMAVAERITTALATPVELDGQRVDCYASIGIALYPDHGQDTEALLKSADMAMYRAKVAGGKRFAIAGEATPATTGNRKVA